MEHADRFDSLFLRNVHTFHALYPHSCSERYLNGGRHVLSTDLQVRTPNSKARFVCIIFNNNVGIKGQESLKIPTCLSVL